MLITALLRWLPLGLQSMGPVAMFSRLAARNLASIAPTEVNELLLAELAKVDETQPRARQVLLSALALTLPPHLHELQNAHSILAELLPSTLTLVELNAEGGAGAVLKLYSALLSQPGVVLAPLSAAALETASEGEAALSSVLCDWAAELQTRLLALVELDQAGGDKEDSTTTLIATVASLLAARSCTALRTTNAQALLGWVSGNLWPEALDSVTLVLSLIGRAEPAAVLPVLDWGLAQYNGAEDAAEGEALCCLRAAAAAAGCQTQATVVPRLPQIKAAARRALSAGRNKKDMAEAEEGRLLLDLTLRALTSVDFVCLPRSDLGAAAKIAKCGVAEDGVGSYAQWGRPRSVAEHMRSGAAAAGEFQWLSAADAATGLAAASALASELLAESLEALCPAEGDGSASMAWAAAEGGCPLRMLIAVLSCGLPLQPRPLVQGNTGLQIQHLSVPPPLLAKLIGFLQLRLARLGEAHPSCAPLLVECAERCLEPLCAGDEACVSQAKHQALWDSILQTSPLDDRMLGLELIFSKLRLQCMLRGCTRPVAAYSSSGSEADPAPLLGALAVVAAGELPASVRSRAQEALQRCLPVDDGRPGAKEAARAQLLVMLPAILQRKGGLFAVSAIGWRRVTSALDGPAEMRGLFAALAELKKGAEWCTTRHQVQYCHDSPTAIQYHVSRPRAPQTDACHLD